MASDQIKRVVEVIYEKLLKNERLLFSGFLLISLLQLWLTKYVPSLDGPQHLYNASVLSNLVKGNELISSFFAVNETIVGYWTSHALLAFFTAFLPAWLAEKIFLSIYVLGMVFAFRYLVKMVNPEKGNFVQFLIFPFIYHSFILMGYYAFSFAAILFFFNFAYYLKYQGEFGIKRVSVFSLLLLMLFLTHALIFVFFCATFIFLYLGLSLYRWVDAKDSFRLKDYLKHSFFLLLSALPALLLWGVYMKSILVADNTVVGASESWRELMIYLLRIRQLVGFHHEMEAVAYVPVFLLIVVLTVVSLSVFVSELKNGSRKLISLCNQKHIWLLASFIFLGLYFFAPNKVSQGSLTNRFALYFFFLIITWLSMQKFPKFLQLLAIVVLLFSTGYARMLHQRFYQNLNKDIADITELTDYMEDNTIVDYRLHSNNWTHLHFPLYAALDGSFAHLRNSQCYGPFPTVWNYEELPHLYAGLEQVSPSGALKVSSENSDRQIDYITVFYKERFWNDSTESKWHDILTEHYQEVHVSKRGRAALYQRKVK